LAAVRINIDRKRKSPDFLEHFFNFVVIHLLVGVKHKPKYQPISGSQPKFSAN